MEKKFAAAAAVAAVAPFVAALALVVTVSTTGSATPSDAVSGTALKAGSVPAQYVPWIERDAGLTSPLLAAQLHQESGFNPSAVSSAGAEGIAQFLPSTFESWSADDDGTGNVTPFNPYDAIMAQGRLMCDLLHKAQASHYNGTPIALALAGYNAGWGAVVAAQGIPPFAQTQHYVAAILAAMASYTDAVPPGGGAADLPPGFSLPPGTPPQVSAAIDWALQQRGGWYQYGGSCTDPLGTSPSLWCDCSSLMQQAYAHAGISIARTSEQQVLEGQPINLDTPLPGDLVFVPGADGSASSPGHVGMYIGDGLLIEAPHTGAQIRLVSFASWRNAGSAQDRVVAIRRIVSQ
jgi:cell wall-associated NlpC family hydrolase